MRKITEMQAEIILLTQQVSDLKKENKRFSQLISSEELSSDKEEYYTANEGPDYIFNHYCKYCKQSFKYPYLLKRHQKMKGKCAKKIV